MHASVTVTPAQLPELLLHVAVVRPVFVWGQPGIGKSSLVEEFAAQVGLECQTLLGTQLAAEDLIGVPRIVGEGQAAKSRFCPPEAIARDEPYVLFLDELNGSSHEVQKAFYSLILDRRLGSYTLHPESVVIGAGNRSQDSAIVRPMSSALINRMVHVHLVSSPRDWLAWARRSGIHPWIIDYISQRPDHLTSAPPRHEEPFSTPRAWHILSDLLHSYGAGPADGTDISDDLLRVLTLGTVSRRPRRGEGLAVPPGSGHGPRRARAGADPAAESRQAGLHLVRRHPLFAPLAHAAIWYGVNGGGQQCPPDGWAVVNSHGRVYLHPKRHGEPEEWAWVAAHCLLHLGFDHLAAQRLDGWTAAAGLPGGARWAGSGGGFDAAWNLAACAAVNRFLAHLKIGRPPAGLGGPTGFERLAGQAAAEEEFARRLRELTSPLNLAGAGTGGPGGDLRWAGLPVKGSWPGPVNWPDLLGEGLADAVGAAVDVAGGASMSLTTGSGPNARSQWRQALGWFVSSYPLLGALAAAFKLVEKADVCRVHGIAVAAISPAAAELYVNPRAGLTQQESRFVIAHELLHAALRHDTRGGGRDPWLWNVACDFVINGWLTEMSVGDLPATALYDPALKGKSAEEVYDQIAAGRRRT